MKKVLIASIIVILYACNTAEKTTPAEEIKEAPAEKAAAISNMSGYTATYSTSFEMGDSKNAEAVLAVYKDWDNGNLEPSKDLFADSVSFFASDGNLIAGPRNSFVADVQKFRDMFSAIKSTVHGIFPVKSADKNENWVCIWATEVNTDKKGKTDSVHLQETWRFNKDGKIDLLYQYGQVAKPVKASN